MAAQGTKPIASNRRARFDYDIIDTVETGIVLQGSEVKSLRLGQVRLADAYARVLDNGQLRAQQVVSVKEIGHVSPQ